MMRPAIALRSLVASLALVSTLLAGARAGAEELRLPASIVDALKAEAQNPEASYDVKMWIGTVLAGRFKDAAHNWGAVSTEIRPATRQAAEATYLYLLWNQKLGQTFADQLIGQLGRKSFVESDAWSDLEDEIAPQLASFLQSHAVLYSQEQQATLAKLPWDGAAVDLKAWAYLRSGAKAAEALAKLGPKHPWRHLLELSAALDMARKRDVAGAIAYLEAQIKDGKVQESALPGYHLQLGRLYYQKADLAKAEENYLKIDVATDEAADAREELLWVWLRKGDNARLRGTLETLAQPRFGERFAPELFVVRAISNLKLCYYDDVKSDFQSFTRQNAAWAKKIDTALNEPDLQVPPNADWYIRLVDEAIAKRAAEKDVIKSLSEESIASSLPGIGVQKHWQQAQSALAAHLARLEKLRQAEYRRQWRNNALLLTEAIRKMRFVKIELISQLNMGQTSKPDSDVSQANAAAAEQAIDAEAAGKWSFPFDGVVWPDELFAARSTAHNVCL